MTTVAQQPGIEEQDSRPSIVDALARVMKDVRGVGKRGRNTQQNYNFRGIDDVLNAVGPSFRDHGVVPFPMLEDVQYRDVKTTTGKASREVTVRVRYRFHGPRGDFQDCVVPGESLDTSDKGVAKAMSVAYRIALIQVLALPTTENDPDAQSWERGTGSVDVSVDAAARDAKRLDRQGMLRRAKHTLNQEREMRGESVYALLDRVARHCKETLGVNVIKKESPEGAVEEVDWDRLNNGQLSVLYAWSLDSMNQINKEAGIETGDDQEPE